MNQNRTRVFAAVIALIGITGLTMQTYFRIIDSWAEGKTALDGIFRLLGYFTILTNAWVAWVMIRVARGKFPGGTHPSTSMLSATTLYITIVGLVYHFLLSAESHWTGARLFEDCCMHYFVPPLTVLFWIFCVPKKKLKNSDALRWMLYPLAYCAVALVRGAVTGWYPYFFLRASQIGWGQTLINAAGLSVIFYLLGLGMIFIASHMSLRTNR